jgi:hypothetical protein
VKVYKELEPFARTKPGDEDRFHLEIKYVAAKAGQTFPEKTQRLLDVLMPLLGASDIERTSAYY